MLVAARALQGSFGALLAPSALSLLTVTFQDSPDRPKAFGIFSAIAASGTSIGLLLGGLLTESLSWRWRLYVNLVFAIPAAIAALRLVNGAGVQRPRPRIDVAGVGLASAGFFFLVYGFSNAENHAWSAGITIAALTASAVLLTFLWPSSTVSGIRCCRCRSLPIAPAVAPMRQWPLSAPRCSRCSCS